MYVGVYVYKYVCTHVSDQFMASVTSYFYSHNRLWHTVRPCMHSCIVGSFDNSLQISKLSPPHPAPPPTPAHPPCLYKEPASFGYNTRGFGGGGHHRWPVSRSKEHSI